MGLAALRRLSMYPDNRARLIRAGVIEPIVVGARSPEVEIQREVAALLCNLSLSEPDRLELATFCVPALVDLAKSKDVEVARQSVGALANLSEDTKTHPVIGTSGGGRVMISLMKHDAIDIFREASRTIANLLSSFEHQATVIEEGLGGLIALGLSPDPECQYHAAMSFRKLGPNLRAHAGLFANKGMATLLFLIKVLDLKTRRQAATALRDLAANDEFKVQYASEGGIEALIGQYTRTHATSSAAREADRQARGCWDGRLRLGLFVCLLCCQAWPRRRRWT